MNRNIFILPALLVLLAVSCQDQYDICDQEKSVNFKGSFYKKTLSGEAETAVPFLTITPVNNPAPIYNQQPNVSSFVFALNPSVNAASYIIKIDNSTVKDTISILYTSQQKNLSVECGDIVTHNISSAFTTTHNLDSVTISNSKVDNQLNSNLKIYF